MAASEGRPPHPDPAADVVVVDREATRLTLEVRGPQGVTRHTIELSRRAALVADGISDERLALAVMRFLLEREPATAILRSFDLDDVTHHFPEFPQHVAVMAEQGTG